jgi:hypothetical protein
LAQATSTSLVCRSLSVGVSESLNGSTICTTSAAKKMGLILQSTIMIVLRVLGEVQYLI